MGVQAVTAAVTVLETVAKHQPVGVSEIARLTGVPKATAQRMLLAWNELGWISKLPYEPVAWFLTGKLLTVASAHSPISELKRVARPIMEELSHSLGGEAIHLVVQMGTGTSLIERIEGTKPVRTNYQIGAMNQLHSTATGLAILSTRSREEVQRLMDIAGMEPTTPHTITALNELFDAIDAGRRRGYFHVDGSNQSETSAIAAPIVRAGGGPAAGAISVSLPTSRLTQQFRADCGEAATAAASRISEALSPDHS